MYLYFSNLLGLLRNVCVLFSFAYAYKPYQFLQVCVDSSIIVSVLFEFCPKSTNSKASATCFPCISIFGQMNLTGENDNAFR